MNLEWAHAPIFFAASRIRLFYRAFLAVRRVRSLSLEKFLETSIARRARAYVHHVKCVNFPIEWNVLHLPFHCRIKSRKICDYTQGCPWWRK